MTEELRNRARRHDRLVSWIVIALVIVSLVVGWVVKATAEGRTVAYNRDTIKLRYPEGWMQAKTQLPVLFEAADRTAAPAGTTIRVERVPISLEMLSPLLAVQQNLALDRGGSLLAYRVLDVQENVTIIRSDGLIISGVHVAFGYVETNANPFQESMPVVMQGEDYLFESMGYVYVFTLTAAETNFAQAHQRLVELIASWR